MTRTMKSRRRANKKTKNKTMAQNICKTGHVMNDDVTFCQICGQISTTDSNATSDLTTKAANNIAPPSTVKKQSK